MNSLWNLAYVGIGLFVGKRIIYGPQMVWARTGGMLAVLGWAFLVSAGAPDSPLRYIGLSLIGVACAVWGLMSLAELLWLLEQQKRES